MLDQLIRYKWWANNNLFRTLAQHQGAAEDEELRRMLLHILVANRDWLFLTLGWKFVREDEMHLPDNLADLIERFKQTERSRWSGFRRRPSQTSGDRSRPDPIAAWRAHFGCAGRNSGLLAQPRPPRTMRHPIAIARRHTGWHGLRSLGKRDKRFEVAFTSAPGITQS